MFYPLFGAPTGFGATLIVAALIARRCLVPRNSATTPSAEVGYITRCELK